MAWTRTTPLVLDFEGISSLPHSHGTLYAGLKDVVDRCSFIARYESALYFRDSLEKRESGQLIKALMSLSSAQSTYPLEEVREDIQMLALSTLQNAPGENNLPQFPRFVVLHIINNDYIFCRQFLF